MATSCARHRRGIRGTFRQRTAQAAKARIGPDARYAAVWSKDIRFAGQVE
jgi:hypothetical protein